VVSFLRLFLSSTFSLMLFSYVEIYFFSWQLSRGKYKDRDGEKKKKNSIHNFFADNPDQNIEI
jgi:hypothetical protein